MENEIKIGEKYWIEVEVTEYLKYNANRVLTKKTKDILSVYDEDLIPLSKLMEVPEIGKEYEFYNHGRYKSVGKFKGYYLECDSENRRYTDYADKIIPIQQPKELEEAIKICEKYGLKIER